MAVDQLSATFAALADPTRRAILARLAEGEATVNQLAALVVGQTVGDGRAVVLDARLAGVAAAAIALALRAPLLVVLVASAGVAAGARALGAA